MDTKKLIGVRVWNTRNNTMGTIRYIEDGYVAIDYHGTVRKYAYPSVFAKILELEDEALQEEIQIESKTAAFDIFKKDYRSAIYREIEYLRITGGKKYRIIDGDRIPSKNEEYWYAFDSDTDMHYPDGTVIKLWFPERIIPAYIVSCEDFTIIIRTKEYLGEYVESVEFTSEQWQLLDGLISRIDKMQPDEDSIAYEIACNGNKQIMKYEDIDKGQNIAFNKATSEKITFIWGPPGTGKTETLSNIAIEHMNKGRRVLMLSYSNVSVDEALLRVADRSNIKEGKIVRYGYPRKERLLEEKTLTSYQFILHKNPKLSKEYQDLLIKKRKMKKKDPEKVEINKKLNRIRESLLKQEKALIHEATFVATTISKATVDKDIYKQQFDVVIFDEASMAYVPQIVFAAGLAKDYFVCLGDFCQLPAIVQNNTDNQLAKDIFEYTGITSAVENDQGHAWLVMLDLQYRMHKDIADFVSQHMYHGKLKTAQEIQESRKEIAAYTPCEKEAISLVDLSKMYSVCIRTKDNSRINVLSAMVCMRLAEKYIRNYKVGIITPYSAQSRLILSMIRDRQEIDECWMGVSCATVHQFQGSQNAVIIYDAVDCFRMSYPGVLLTTLRNDTADRLFNVALTRTEGKFILVANKDYFVRKKISKKLMFTKMLYQIEDKKSYEAGGMVLDELMPIENEEPAIYIEDRDVSWTKFIRDIKSAKSTIHITLPDIMDENDEAIENMIEIFKLKQREGVDIYIKASEDIYLQDDLQDFVKVSEYANAPICLIDKKIVWFGQPLYAADFISEGDIIDTEYFPCARVEGKYCARLVQAFLEI